MPLRGKRFCEASSPACVRSRSITSAASWVSSKREAARHAEALGVLPEHAEAERVERAAADPLAAAVEEARRAGEHLGRGAARERQQRHRLWRRAGLDEVGHAVDERPRLARAGAGYDERRPRAGRCRGELLWVEVRRVVDLERRRALGERLGAEDEAAGHGGEAVRR